MRVGEQERSLVCELMDIFIYICSFFSLFLPSAACVSVCFGLRSERFMYSSRVSLLFFVLCFGLPGERSIYTSRVSFLFVVLVYVLEFRRNWRSRSCYVTGVGCLQL